jgi:carboxymethylenebutenolidase
MPRTSVTIETRHGQAPASVFTPSTQDGPWPAVLVYQDGRGIRPALFELGERLASAGYYVLLPDLFYRAGPYEAPGPTAFTDDPEYRKRWFSDYISTANQSNVRSDNEAFFAFLGEQPQVRGREVGTTGYCMGGALSLVAAAQFPDRVVAAASYHGGNLATDKPDSPHLLADRIKARVYVAGAIEDASFDDAQKQRLTAALDGAGVANKVETYEGALHGWVPTDSHVHNPEAAERHWRSLIDLYNRTLKREAH